MKNTVEILVDGLHNLPLGTKAKQYEDGKLIKETVVTDHVYSCRSGRITGSSLWMYEVDFDDLPPLYPTKGMTVPVGGIKFKDGSGVLLDAGNNGFTHGEGVSDARFVYWTETYGIGCEITRTLPKTVTVCADCRKPVCECVHAEGWYRVKFKTREWEVCFYTGKNWQYFVEATWCTPFDVEEVDWKNPISVTPEGEV